MKYMKYKQLVNEVESPIKSSKHVGCLPRRYWLCLLSFIGLFNVYTLRVNLSVAIEPMSCQFDWSSFKQGFVLSAFFGGYLFGNIPGGWLAIKYGGKLVFGLGVLCTALLTMIVPFCTSGSFINDKSLNCYCSHDNSWCFDNGHYTNNDETCYTIKHTYHECNEKSYIYILIPLRVLMGLFESVTFPALLGLFTYWTPKNERSRMVGISFAGMAMGTTLGFPISSFIVASDNNIYGGWVNVFYLFGIIGILWWIVWCLFVYDTPFNDPYISAKELNYLRNELPSTLTNRFMENIVINEDNNEFQQKKKQKIVDKIQWKYFFTEPAALAIYAAHFSFDWSFYTLLTELPSYLNDELDFDFSSAGFISILPYLGQFIVSIIGSIIIDKLIETETLSRGNARKIGQIVATIIPGILLVLCGYLNNVAYVVVLLSTAAALMGVGNSAYNANCTDISPTLSSIVYGIQNTVGTIPGIVSPILTGYILSGKNKKQEWQIIFYIAFGIFFVGTVIYCIFGSGEVVESLNKKQQLDPKIADFNDIISERQSTGIVNRIAKENDTK